MRAFASVLFPDPLGPMIACFSPARMARLTPWTISLSPIATWMSRNSKSGASAISVAFLSRLQNQTVRRALLENEEGRLPVLEGKRVISALGLAPAPRAAVLAREEGGDLRCDRGEPLGHPLLGADQVGEHHLAQDAVHRLLEGAPEGADGAVGRVNADRTFARVPRAVARLVHPPPEDRQGLAHRDLVH